MFTGVTMTPTKKALPLLLLTFFVVYEFLLGQHIWEAGILTIPAIFGTMAGDPDLVPAAVIAWLSTIRTRRPEVA